MCIRDRDKYDAANYGWLIAKTDEQIETSFADIENALALSDNVVVTDAANITAGHYLATAANIKGATITFKAGLTVNEDVTVPEDSAFIIEGNLAIDGDDTLTVNGEVEVSGTLSGNSSMAGTGKVTANIAWNLGNFVGVGAGATIEFTGSLATNPINNGVTQTFYADGVVVITYTQIANSTFEFDLNAAGTGNSGFVKQ